MHIVRDRACFRWGAHQRTPSLCLLDHKLHRDLPLPPPLLEGMTLRESGNYAITVAHMASASVAAIVTPESTAANKPRSC